MGGIKMKHRDAAQTILKEFFGRRKKSPFKQAVRPKISPTVLRLNATRLPHDLLKFSLQALSKRDPGTGGTIVQRPRVPNPKPKDLNKFHVDAVDSVEEYDFYLAEQLEKDDWAMNTELVNNKLLFLVYDPEDYRLRKTCWFSFKDKMIYRWISYEEALGFYEDDEKTILKPMPYKIWMRETKHIFHNKKGFKDPKVIIYQMEHFWFGGKKKISPNDKVSKYGFDELSIVDFLIWLQDIYKTKLKEPSYRVVKGWVTNGKVNDIIKYILDKRNWG
jgi:hypothetical protein